ncbi:Hypothetical predicted protein [Cloeon dipterum]|uniref:Uncharacterized protein n=1 Tax=Cloeon dipterum TaxID=197152 RepID=A0A8S1DWD1_9INSE|nr:Hypothetical predicted protein [Cloeon dipterum]
MDYISNKSSVLFISNVGKVDSLVTKHKALVKFAHSNGEEEMALLKTDRFVHRGAIVWQAGDEQANLSLFVAKDTKIRFVAHPLDSKDGEGDAQWFILFGWDVQEEAELAIKYIPGLANRDCVVSEIDITGKRKGVLNHTSAEGKSIDINFLASKVWNFGNRLSAKHSLKLQMAIDDQYYCDAIPQLSLEDEDDIIWTATNVWRGPKHQSQTENDHSKAEDISSLISPIKNIGLNSRALFVKGQGQVFKIINDEFGLALLHIGLNIFETVLFHRAWVYAYGTCMVSQKLGDFLQDGDPLRIMCTATNYGSVKNSYSFKWVACSVHLALEAP